MANTIFEKTGGTYKQVGNYIFPNLLPTEEKMNPLSAYEVFDTNDICGKIIVCFATIC